MILKYLGFLLTLFWSYSFIKTQSLFKKGSLKYILVFYCCLFYGFKNFKFYYVLIGISFIFALVGRLSLFINSKFQNKENLIRIKTIVEYLIIVAIFYYIFN